MRPKIECCQTKPRIHHLLWTARFWQPTVIRRVGCQNYWMNTSSRMATEREEAWAGRQPDG